MTDEERLERARKNADDRAAVKAELGNPCKTCRWADSPSSSRGSCDNPAADLAYRVSPVTGKTGATISLRIARDEDGFCGPRGLFWEGKFWVRHWPIIRPLLMVLGGFLAARLLLLVLWVIAG